MGHQRVAKHEDTKAFHDSYYSALNDDDEDFAHLRHGVDEEMDAASDGDDGEEREEVSTKDLMQELRAAAAKGDDVSAHQVLITTCSDLEH